jgi:hypothetical protein
LSPARRARLGAIPTDTRSRSPVHNDAPERRAGLRVSAHISARMCSWSSAHRSPVLCSVCPPFGASFCAAGPCTTGAESGSLSRQPMLQSADTTVHTDAPREGTGAPTTAGHVPTVTCSTYGKGCKKATAPGRGVPCYLGGGTPMPHKCTLSDDCPSCGRALDGLITQVDGYAVLVEETGHALQALLLSQLDAVDQVEEALELFAQRHKLVS